MGPSRSPARGAQFFIPPRRGNTYLLWMKKRIPILLCMLAVLVVGLLFTGCVTKPEKLGMAYHAETRAEQVRLLVDETWVDADGTRHVKQEIFDSIYEMIDAADAFILLDLFLMNDFGFEMGPCMRPVTQELADRLVAKKASHPEVEIVFITDPVNTMYGSLESPQFTALTNAGARVVFTDLDQLRDSNPLYSKPWRLLGKPWGVGPGKTLKNPMGEGRVSMRSMLKMLNFKANHRKVVVTDKAVLLTSANPHSASSAHWNVALRIDGAGQAEAVEMEAAVLRFSDAADAVPTVEPAVPSKGHRIEFLSEVRIKEKVLALLEGAEPGARVDLCVFYLSEKQVIQALVEATQRGVHTRVILDPSKDSFGRTKNGVPNRQSGRKLVKGGVPVRWAHTHGEQCHVKMLYVENPDGTATLLLGSCNYTRRNMDNLNCEANVALTAPLDELNLARARETFDRWWHNEQDKTFTADYEQFEDNSMWRRFSAWWGENTGLSIF